MSAKERVSIWYVTLCTNVTSLPFFIETFPELYCWDANIESTGTCCLIRSRVKCHQTTLSVTNWAFLVNFWATTFPSQPTWCTSNFIKCFNKNLIPSDKGPCLDKFGVEDFNASTVLIESYLRITPFCPLTPIWKITWSPLRVAKTSMASVPSTSFSSFL